MNVCTDHSPFQAQREVQVNNKDQKDDHSYRKQGNNFFKLSLKAISSFAIKIFELIRFAADFAIKNLKAFRFNLANFSFKSLLKLKFDFSTHNHFCSSCFCKKKNPKRTKVRQKSIFMGQQEIKDSLKMKCRVRFVEEMGLEGLIFTIEKIYFHKIGKPTLKDNCKLTDDEIRIQAEKARKIGEGAINDFKWCIDKIFKQTNNELFPYLPKTPIEINLSDDVFQVRNGVQMLEHLIKISPENRTENLKKILIYMSKYIQIWERLTDRHLIYKVHKIADQDLTTLLENPRTFSALYIEDAKLYVFNSIEKNIQKYEKLFGKIVI